MITPQQIKLVKESWQSIAAMDALTTGEVFYNCLFEIAPEVKSMFSRASMNEQSGKLIYMIDNIIRNLDNMENIMDSIAKLAGRHVNYGVQEEQYTMVGRALLWTLQKASGEKWDNELKQAWINCYTILAEVMIKAAKQNEQKNEMVY
ncbi:MAG: globin domain-containing protein [Chitinophagaceae bacterium]